MCLWQNFLFFITTKGLFHSQCMKETRHLDLCSQYRNILSTAATNGETVAELFTCQFQLLMYLTKGACSQFTCVIYRSSMTHPFGNGRQIWIGHRCRFAEHLRSLIHPRGLIGVSKKRVALDVIIASSHCWTILLISEVGVNPVETASVALACWFRGESRTSKRLCAN